jgi:hypothetical protein
VCGACGRTYRLKGDGLVLDDEATP